MPAVKISVSMDSNEVAWLRRQAKLKKKSLSAVLSDSVRQTRRQRALDEVLTWLEAPKLTLKQLEEYRKLWQLD